jgi:hypothetical protein
VGHQEGLEAGQGLSSPCRWGGSLLA